MEEFKIQEYTSEYADQLKNLLVTLQAHISSLDKRGVIILRDSYREDYFNLVIREMQEHDGRIYLAFIGEDAIGAIVCKIFQGGGEADITTSCPRIGFISDLVVKEQFRHQGIGKQLLQMAEKYFSSKDCEYMQLEVFEPNIGAAKMYEKYGLSTVSRYLSKRI